MKILLDMNLSPRWVGFLEQEGFEAAHWSTVGDPRATDAMDGDLISMPSLPTRRENGG